MLGLLPQSMMSAAAVSGAETLAVALHRKCCTGKGLIIKL